MWARAGIAGAKDTIQTELMSVCLFFLAGLLLTTAGEAATVSGEKTNRICGIVVLSVSLKFA